MRHPLLLAHQLLSKARRDAPAVDNTDICFDSGIGLVLIFDLVNTLAVVAAANRDS